MVFFFALFMACGLLLARNYNRRWMSLLSVFSLLWGIIIVFSHLRLYGMVKVSDKTYGIVYLGCIMYMLGYIVHVEWKKKKYRFIWKGGNRKVAANGNYIFNHRMILSLELIVLGFELMIAARVMSVLVARNSFAVVHDMIGGYTETTILNGAIETYMDSWIIMPAVFALIPICLVALFEPCKYKKWIILFGMLDFALFIFVHGGRVILLYFMVYLALLYSIYGIKLSPKIKRRIIIGVLAVVLGILAITFIRKGIGLDENGAWESVLTSIYQYFSVSMPLLDYWVERTDQYEVITYGLATFHGPLSFITTFTEKVGVYFLKFNQASQFIDLSESVFVSGLYRKGVFNAFVSIFYFFYMDFRWFGVVLGSFLYGIFCHACEYLGNKENVYRLALYLLVAQGVIKSFGRWEFYLTSYCLAFIFLRVCFKKRRDGYDL